MNTFGTFRTLSPQSLLRHLSSCYDTTSLQAFSKLVTWAIYLNQGKIIYATHSVEPFDRLERHLHRLSDQIPPLTSEIRVQLRLIFEPDLHNQFIEDDSDLNHQPADYQAIHWLINQGYLNTQQATLLLQELVTEVVESFLLIKSGHFALSHSQPKVSEVCRLDVGKVIERCQIQLDNWRILTPYISSPYQRPYLLINNIVHNQTFTSLQANLINWMKGFSLRHLAMMMNQDEIELAKTLYPYIIKGEVILHEPDPPFDQLPRNVEKLSLSSSYSRELLQTNLVAIPVETSNNTIESYADNSVEQFPDISDHARENIQGLTISNNINPPAERVMAATITPKKVYKIVSVDDSPTILKEISRFLEGETFFVVAINNPLKAVMSIIRHQPDLILLDLNMAGIDGYELCRLIRNNPIFQNTPVIFVTGYKGIIDRVKARLVGATGYLTKPFTRVELLKIVFKNLT
ncbi:MULTISPECIES: response regulator [unclassified Nodularia (in: cyanobacteria)]|uniref:response regulator n=1 Tax=unclassified Nodularia (in: cyanobacteria) TaxID=2656917 RepID=UPI001880CB5E|nr:MULTISPECIES: response regulator [unclassified Nodularia (in: cyanobacteria)]MBE9197769.1 response regulator [Nodularia sp. LEGE 06071]MCC2692589.1 response regulator [Nodularia sp. LEGE 04288]